MGAASRNAAPAPCWWTAKRCGPAPCRSQLPRAKRSRPSKAWRQMAGRIRCRQPGWRRTCPNAATASPARSCRQWRCCSRSPIRPTRISIPSPIFAAAAPMSASGGPSIALRERSKAMPHAKTYKPLSRRQVVVTGTTLAGGMALGFFVPSSAKAAAPELAAQYWGGDAADPREVNAWVVIGSDGTVTLRCPMAEMGQGTGSGLPMLLAEELECDWKQVRVEFASVNRNIREDGVYRDMLTVGSRGIRTTYEYVQQAGASARERLVAAAAARWNVPAAECEASNSVVGHKATNRRLTYAELVPDAGKITLAQEPVIKPPSRFKLVGTRQPRLDSAIKSDGSARFGIDTRLPGQLYASIMSCPVPGGKLASLDEGDVAARRGIKRIVKLPDAVAVV